MTDTEPRADHRPRVLFLVHRVPYPPNRGDRLRSFRLLRYLSQRAQVWLACLADEEVDTETLAVLRNCCSEVVVAPIGVMRWFHAALSAARGNTATEGLFHSIQLRTAVRDWCRRLDFDCVFAFCSGVAPYTQIPELDGVPLIVDLVDVDSRKWFDYADSSSGLKRLLYRLEGRRLGRLERTLGERAQAVALVSEAEAEIYRELTGHTNVCAIRQGVDVGPRLATLSDNGPTCILVGSMNYRPNIDAVCWFASEVWPTVLQGFPSAKFLIVGRSPTKDVQRLDAARGITVTGAVPAVGEYLRQASVSIAPLQIARGVQTKILEAMAAGLPVVASKEALFGLDAEPGTHLIEAGTVDEWSTAVSNLFNDVPYRNRLSNAGRRYVEQHHDWEAALAPLEKLLPRRQAPNGAPLESAVGV